MSAAKAQAFLSQARSDWDVFEHLMTNSAKLNLPWCHCLHYLQMTAEKATKAIHVAVDSNFDVYKHPTVTMLVNCLGQDSVARALGFRDKGHFAEFYHRHKSVLRQIDELHPQVGASRSTVPIKRQPNVEYPWELGASSDQWNYPENHTFQLGRLIERQDPVFVGAIRFLRSLIVKDAELISA